jgi:hypothetical protein
MLFRVSFAPNLVQEDFPRTLDSLVTLGILKEAIVDMLAMWGCAEAIEKPLLNCETGRRLLEVHIEHGRVRGNYCILN